MRKTAKKNNGPTIPGKFETDYENLNQNTQPRQKNN